MLASAGLPPGQDPRRRATAVRGRIANDGRHQGDRILSALFFAGPPNPVTRQHFYARTPLEEGRLDWTDRADIDFAVQQFASAGLNTMKLSYFGHRGETDAFAPAWLFSRQRWDGPGTYTEAEQISRVVELFDTARQRDLLIAPMLEVSPEFRFWEAFPADLDGLVERAVWLLGNFGDQPNHLKLYDALGQERHVIWLIESIHGGPIDPLVFAAGFDRAAELIRRRTGHQVGMIVDPTPLPGFGSHEGPDPAALRDTPSVLAVNPYNITSQSLGPRKPQAAITEDERLAYARGILTRWNDSGIPFVAPVIPGFDDRHLPFRDDPAVYGFNLQWRQRQRALALEFATAGLSVETWNGYSEAHAIVPTVEDGGNHLLWLRDIVLGLRRRWR
ncbi:hypothetical protein [Nonomuraea sp. NPDC050643]|uniref:hypothetical protein n=1 Tax=Nonomuraea sp. NPDC050643 TaxID=3155660 RepID=UPI00340D49E5